MMIGGNVSKNIPKKVIDVTGIELTPGDENACLGNGDHGFECCCDECDYYLFCFPEFDPRVREEYIDIYEDYFCMDEDYIW